MTCLAHCLVALIFPAVVLCSFGSVRADGELSSPPATPQDVRSSVRRGLTFLEQDVVKWRNEHQCSTCHHGTLTVWVYSEAKQQGYSIDAAVMKDTFGWAKERIFENVDKPRDPRPGWKMVNSSAIYLAMMAQCVDQQTAVTPEERSRIEQHLLRHQEADGSWAWSSAPPGNRPPPFFESDEVATRLAYLAISADGAGSSQEDADILNSRAKAIAWLAMSEPADTTQAAAIRLLMKDRTKESADGIQFEIAQLLRRQNIDGGWGQLSGLSSDGYATGQAIYVLALVGVHREREEIRRAVTFLVHSQLDDGSWPMKSRAHPEAEPYKNPIPITYFGSGWATLGLMRSVPGEIAEDTTEAAKVNP